MHPFVLITEEHAQRAFGGKELLSTSFSFDPWPMITHQPSISALGIWLSNYFLSRFLDPLTSPTSDVSHHCPKRVQHSGCATVSPCPCGCHEHQQMGLVLTDPSGGFQLWEACWVPVRVGFSGCWRKILHLPSSHLLKPDRLSPLPLLTAW